MVTILAAIASLGFSDELKMPALFSSHMVLQRNSTVNVWGWGKTGSKVGVSVGWNRSHKSATVDSNGKWTVAFKTTEAGGPYTIHVKSGKSIDFDDVMLGDVWVCSGQSNMEWPMAASDHAKEDIAVATNSKIRLFHLQKSMQAKPQEDCTGTWQVCLPEAVASFSAVGYLFGKEVQQKTGIPIGLVDTTWGGTEAELWTSEPGLMKLPDFAAKLSNKAQAQKDFEKAHAAWEKQLESKDPGYKGWNAVGLDDSNWTKTEIKPWSNMEELKNFDGSCWFRGTFDAPQRWAGRRVNIQMGVIDDDESTWVNGKLIGSTKGWNVKRAYEIPEGVVVAGKNVVTVRIWDAAGEGGWTTPERQCNVSLGDELGAIENWKYKIGSPKDRLPAEPLNNSMNNSLLYNGMIHPLVSNPIKGAIWYQGESNVGRAFQYRTLFPAMIKDWRRIWGKEFPFYYVQIAPFSGYGSVAAAELREAQDQALLLPHTGVALVTDAVENLQDIHPRDKRTPGHRLALWALHDTYKMSGFEFSGPMYNSMVVSGNKVTLMFKHGAGLKSAGGALKEFEIAGADKVFHPATAVIDGPGVVVSSPDVSKPVAVRMGWSTAPQPNLFNSAGLPAVPFRTDNWPGLTDKNKW